MLTMNVTRGALAIRLRSTQMIDYVLSHWKEILLAVQALLAAGILISALIPGEQPDKIFKTIADLVAKFSKK